MRSFSCQRKGSAEICHLVSAAWVTLEHGRLAVTNLSHDLHGALAVGAEGHFGARHERDDPEGPLAAAALGRRSQNGLYYRGQPGPVHAGAGRSCRGARPAARSGVSRRRALLLGERRKNRAATRVWAIVLGELARRRRIAAAVRIGAGNQAIDRQVAGGGHRPREMRTVNDHLEQHGSPHVRRLHPIGQAAAS